MAGGGKERADVPLGPTAVRVLPGGEIIEYHLAVFVPAQSFTGPRIGEHLGVAILAEHVQGLSIVIMRVFPVSETVASRFINRNRPLAKLDPLLGQFGFIFAGTEETGNGRGGQRRSLGAVESRPVCQAVNDPAIRRCAVFKVGMSLIDDRIGDRYTGDTGGAQ